MVEVIWSISLLLNQGHLKQAAQDNVQTILNISTMKIMTNHLIHMKVHLKKYLFINFLSNRGPCTSLVRQKPLMMQVEARTQHENQSRTSCSFLKVARFMKILVCLQMYCKCHYTVSPGQVPNLQSAIRSTCFWVLPALLLLRSVLQCFADFILISHQIMFPDGSQIKTSTKVTAPHPTSDFGPLPLVPDEISLNTARQHLHILLYTYIPKCQAMFSGSSLLSCTLFLFR